MSYFATLDTDGRPTGFYTPEIHGDNVPEEAVEITGEQWLEFINNAGNRKLVGGEVVEYAPPPPVPTVEDYRAAIVAHLDNKAKERLYDSAVSIVTYRGSTVQQWADEAAAFVPWRDAVWAYAYAELDKVMGGLRPQPTVAELIGELPALTWPA